MSLSYKDATRNTRLADLVSALGTAAYLEIFTGSPPGKSSRHLQCGFRHQAGQSAVLQSRGRRRLGRRADIFGDHIGNGSGHRHARLRSVQDGRVRRGLDSHHRTRRRGRQRVAQL